MQKALQVARFKWHVPGWRGRIARARRRATRALVFLTAGWVALVAGPPPSAATCAGDCDMNGAVAINELIAMVAIALGAAPLDTCAAGDVDGDGEIAVHEIVAAVNHALGTCPVPEATPTPTPPAVTPTPSATQTPGPLGRWQFVLDPARSTLAVVGVAGDAPLVLGGFQGQVQGETGFPAYLELEAGQPDAQGLATVDVTGASDFFYVDATEAAQFVMCMKPLAPVRGAGLLACTGGVDFSLALTQDHHLGQVGVDGFTVADCLERGGTVEAADRSCDGPEDTCSTVGAHPDVCNGPLDVGQLGGNSGRGAALFALVPELGLAGLPLEMHTERALPCGDEGQGAPVSFAFTTAAVRASILNVNNATNRCRAGDTEAACTVDADCDSEPGAGDGACGAALHYDTTGENFSCTDWGSHTARGCLVFAAPQLDANPVAAGGDVITTLKLCTP